MGFSLDEIKRYLKNKDLVVFLSSLKVRSEDFKEKIERAKRQLQLIENIISLTEEGISRPQGEISVSKQKERKYRFIRFEEPKVLETDQDFIEFFYRKSHSDADTWHLLPWIYQLSVPATLDGMSLFKGFTPIRPSKSIGENLVLPEGLYASWFCQGNMAQHIKFNKSQLLELQQTYLLDTNMYSCDLVADVFYTHGEIFTSKYEIQIFEKN